MTSTTRKGRAFNGYEPTYITVGHVEVTEPFERRINFETASNYMSVTVEPGTYAVEVEAHDTYWVFVRYAGVVSDYHYVNRLGASSSLADKTPYLGKAHQASAQLYDYVAARNFLDDPNWHLNDDWSVVMNETTLTNGARLKSFKLRPKQPAFDNTKTSWYHDLTPFNETNPRNE